MGVFDAKNILKIFWNPLAKCAQWAYTVIIKVGNGPAENKPLTGRIEKENDMARKTLAQIADELKSNSNDTEATRESLLADSIRECHNWAQVHINSIDEESIARNMGYGETGWCSMTDAQIEKYVEWYESL